MIRMKRCFQGKTFESAKKRALEEYPKFHYVNGKKVNTNPNLYEIELKKRKRGNYKKDKTHNKNHGRMAKME